MDKRQRLKGRAPGDSGRHVRLYHWLLNTAAWGSLDTVARCAYIELLKLYNGTNNGQIALGVRALGAALHVAPKTAARALLSLESHGFVVQTKKGAFHYKVRHASEYRLTEFVCGSSNALPTKDFTRWQKQTSVHAATPDDACDDTGRGT